MNKIIFITILFLTACNPNISGNDLNISDQTSFDEIKLKLIEYSKNNPYPNIDE